MAELTGVTIGITAERRADEFIAALERKGASVWHAPTIRIVPLPDDTLLRAATADVLSGVDFTVITTGAGFRGWADAADGWGMELVPVLGRSRIFTRGPKAVGAVRGRGLTEHWSAASETNAELFSGLVATGVSGARVAVQLHGGPLPEFTGQLLDAGASVIEAQPYRWLWPEDLSPARQLIEGVLSGEVGALAFTSAPAAKNLLTLARDSGRLDALVDALRGDVVCACVGPVTAAPLAELGITTLQPERQRLGALVKLLASALGS
ncbi:uroporphyrinogen-III synthase [Amycolatopsis sp. NPDC059657]|uniref:uroporphyrinogen-III synthase n=1 Tax=Amycolatopsis sp. NPDC059657 TaxID=3346899 RepID=UPI00366F0C2A